MKQVGRTQLAFEREAEPHGLFDPGKTYAWGRPKEAATRTSTDRAMRSFSPGSFAIPEVVPL